MSRIDAALRDLRTLEELAARDTPLARIDPRAKVLVTLVFIVVVVSFDRHAVAALLPLAAFPVLLAVRGEVPAAPVLRKLLLASPFAVMVGLANPLLDRVPMLVVGDAVISAGWVSFASILLRFALTVGAALVLVAGTGMHALCVALGRLGVPGVFTAQLLFLFRYAFVIGEEAARMAAARDLRCGGRRTRLAEWAPLAGHLLLRAFERAQRIHRAMSARGFDGELRSLRALRWTVRDTGFVAGWVAFFTLARAVDLPLALGRMAVGG
ncbi:MAG: cobalt ECF transporter T component CbiQ [Burkholderiaceae bacterium]|jgi:cobalt/nickel transport system permease protein|nr:cobalt ECF transporter T component CbiQ [Burkholderiaceae bacterium]